MGPPWGVDSERPAYYSEDRSRDLAKMLPLAPLGVVLLEGAPSTSVGGSLALVGGLADHWRPGVASLPCLVIPESGLRIARIVATGRLQTVVDPPPEEDGV